MKIIAWFDKSEVNKLQFVWYSMLRFLLFFYSSSSALEWGTKPHNRVHIYFSAFHKKKNQIMKRIIPASDEKNNNGMLSVCVHLRSRAAQHWKLAIKLMLCEVLEPRRAEQFKRWNSEEKKIGKYAHNYLPIVTCNLILWLWLFIMLFLLSFSLTTSARKP